MFSFSTFLSFGILFTTAGNLTYDINNKKFTKKGNGGSKCCSYILHNTATICNIKENHIYSTFILIRKEGFVFRKG